MHTTDRTRSPWKMSRSPLLMPGWLAAPTVHLPGDRPADLDSPRKLGELRVKRAREYRRYLEPCGMRPWPGVETAGPSWITSGKGKSRPDCRLFNRLCRQRRHGPAISDCG